jgi:hypothetical protein
MVNIDQEDVDFWINQGIWDGERHKSPELKHWYSAAAAAIHFLEHLSPHIRREIRNIIIDENEEGVGRPECHARGLIPLCQDNPSMRIERKLHILKAVLSDKYRTANYDRFKEWFEEALDLEHNGMPAGSFKLRFEDSPPVQGGKIGSQTLPVLALLKHVALLQEAYVRCRTNGWVIPPQHFYPSGRLPRQPFDYPTWFSSVVKDIITGKSLISFYTPSIDLCDWQGIEDHNEEFQDPLSLKLLRLSTSEQF